MKNLLEIEAMPVAGLREDLLIQLQSLLILNGYDITLDGKFGEETRSAFTNFKLDYQLTRPDDIGQTTVAKLIEALTDRDSLEAEGKPKPEQKVDHNAKVVPAKIDWTAFDCPVSKYFVVGEVCQWDKERIPTDQKVQENIVNLAINLDKIRKDWGKGIGVTSWYRPPHVNRRVGGASRSQHLTGGAVDIYPIGGDLVQFQNYVDHRWYGALGYGAAKGFVHLDIRNGRGWKSQGQKGARWNY